jgi:hypothetical protein
VAGAAGRDDYHGHGRLDAGAAVIAAAAQMTADTAPPSAAISAPTGGTVSGSVTIQANASDNVSVAREELLANGKLVGSDTSAPCSFAWDSTSVGNGTVTLSVVAFDDAGNSGLSVPVAVKVSNATEAVAPDAVPPTVTILNPANGARVSGTVKTSASASDKAGNMAATSVVVRR